MIRPLNNRVLVKRKKAETKSESGLLFIPTEAQDRPVEGTVMALGPKCEGFEKGDVVLFAKYAGMIFDQGLGEEYLLLTQDDILGVF